MNIYLLLTSTVPFFKMAVSGELDIKLDPDCLEVENITGDVCFTPEEEKALLRKIDTHLLPTIWIMYLLSYMDRTKYVA